MNISYDGEKAIISGERIDPCVVFDCGQTFRFEKSERGMSGIAMGKRIYVETTGENLVIYPTTQDEMQSVWTDYFDLDFSYTELERGFEGDEVLKRTLTCCSGMRLLNQEPFETLISFIVSQNNHIPRIKKIVAGICREFGTHIGENDYAFPTREQLSRATVQDMKELGVGYRADYIVNTVNMLGQMNVHAIFEMDYFSAKGALQELSGVGPKVADCVLLFAFKKKNAFPKDVWIKRVLSEYYDFTPKNDRELVAFANEKFGEYGGIAQQYLFHYIRMQNPVKSK